MKRDILESMIDIGSGFIIAIIIQLTIFPFYGITVSIFENFQIALIFLIVSMTRSALWRRFFRRRKDYDDRLRYCRN